jgi:hypothetical protein
MSFRRDSSRDLKWRDWIRQHRDELLTCGIPLIVLAEEDAWLYFLDHGNFVPTGMPESIVSIKALPNAEARRLLEFLEQSDYYPECPTVRDLRRRFAEDREK